MRSASRAVIAIVLACQWTAVGSGTAAGAYPERAIRLVVGFPAGGSSDAIASHRTADRRKAIRADVGH